MQGKLGNAKVMYEEAVAIWKKAYGGDHPKVALGLNNIGELAGLMVGLLRTLLKHDG